jgi:hypothetical protein
MARVHWLGAGLSSGPGIRRLASWGKPLTLWNRTVKKAEEVLAAVDMKSADVRAFDPSALRAALAAGDVVVSMLPAPMHPEIAGLCLDAGTHFVSTSYISEAMRALSDAARARGLSFLNECGLDPGLDHMLAHKLVAALRASPAFDPQRDEVSFFSYCGGFPKHPNDFKYKFSWSPLGVLRALKSPARAIRDGGPFDAPQPWKAVTPFRTVREDFEVYPNRDSVPYLGEYHFDPAWKVRDFVRGTIRLKGWSAAWSDVFKTIETADEAALVRLSEELWSRHAYAPGEPDRVVLSVGLVARRPSGDTSFESTWVMDEAGTPARTAMGALVSLPASLAVEWVLAGDAPRGVHGAPESPELIDAWFAALEREDGLRVVAG